MLYIKEELDLNTFEAWGGAVGRLDDIIELGIVEQAQEYMEDMLDNGNPVTSTDINDLLWLGMDDFIEYFAEMQEEEEAEKEKEAEE